MSDRPSNVALIVAGFAAKADQAVAKAVGHARAHAVTALTKALIDTRPGRATLRKASKSPSYAAALADLDDLQSRLAGPTSASLSGLLRDARERIYREAWTIRYRDTPAAFRVASDAISRERIAEVRGLPIHGYELRLEIGGPIDRARNSLAPTLNNASLPGLIDEKAIGLIDAWATRSRNAISAACRTSLNDAAGCLDGLALIYTTRPEFRPDDEYHPKG